jgi:phosphoheptose isomerase
MKPELRAKLGALITKGATDSAGLQLAVVASCSEQIVRAAEAIARALSQGGKVVLFGNGGSAAQAQHIAAELAGRFRTERRPLPALSLASDISVLTSLGNDYGFEEVFARQVCALVETGDVAIAVSTSGVSPNVLAAVRMARTRGATTIGLTGRGGGKLGALCDVPIVVPADRTDRIQEGHALVGHLICELVDTLLHTEERDEVAREWGEETTRDGALEKMVGWDRLLELRAAWRAAGLRVVWTNGCFDLLHVGHARSLRAAKAYGDILVVGVNSDRSARQIKGQGRPIVPQAERAELLCQLLCVDHVVIFDEEVPVESIRCLQPDVHCKGADYAPPDGKPVPEAAEVAAYGGRVEFLPLVPGLSTTALLKAIKGLDERE